jgi:hypothetical protein
VSHDGLHTAAQMPEAVVRRILRPLHKTNS